MPTDQGEVYLGNRPLLDLPREVLMSQGCSGDDHEPRGVGVQPVDKAGAQPISHAFQLRVAGEKGIHERATGVSRSRVDGEARRLVYNYNLAVLVNDRQR